MARKTLVFFLILLGSGLTSSGQAQDATRGGGDPLRWTSPRPQVRPIVPESSVRSGMGVGQRSVILPVGHVGAVGAAPAGRGNVIQTAAQAPVIDADSSDETSSVLKRRQAEAASRGTPSSGSQDVGEVTVAARKIGGRGGVATTSPATPTFVDASVNTKSRGATPKALSLRCPNPALVLEATGPKSVTVGRPATYQVSAQNPSQDAAVGVEVRVHIPEWIDVPAMQASLGEASRPAAVEGAASAGWVLWTIPELAAGARVDLTLQIVPRDNRVFELAMDWTQQAPSASVAVTVQQPQLQLAVAGPKDAKFGENVALLITVANPGTGDAENVTVRLTTGGNTPETIPVGLVPAGQQKQIELQMAANQPGMIAITSEATADGDIRAEAATELLVRKAELQLVVSSPEKAFTGSPVTYQVKLSNTGNAPSDDTTVSVTLPVGAKLEAGTEGSQSTDGGLVWRIGSLPPGIERLFEIQCEATTAGENRLEAKVTTAAGISLSESAVTEVQALADLKLAVVEPTGARRVGEEIVYEVSVVNRGSKAAEDISVLVQFSEGLEPVGADGQAADLAEGQVIFQPISRLGAGQKTVLKVRAKAEQAGNHRFRIQVTDQSETQLVSEGTTRFFGETGKTSAAEPTPAPARPASFTSGKPTPARR